MIDVILTPLYVQTVEKIGIEGAYCDICHTDTDVCTDGCKI